MTFSWTTIRRMSCAAVALGAMHFAGANASAQQVQQSYGLPFDELTPIDPRVSDVGPLSTSMRQLYPGLGVPTGFSNVYRVPGRDDLLMRIDGGITAVFPESVYVRTQDGVAPVVPPNTVFYIGLQSADSLAPFAQVPGTALPDRSIPQASSSSDSRIYDLPPMLPPGSHIGETTRAIPPADNSAVATSALRMTQPDALPAVRINAEAGPAIVSDEHYRANRMHKLLERAAESRAQSQHAP